MPSIARIALLALVLGTLGASAEPLSAPQLDAHVASLSKLLQMRRAAHLQQLGQGRHVGVQLRRAQGLGAGSEGPQDQSEQRDPGDGRHG